MSDTDSLFATLELYVFTDFMTSFSFSSRVISLLESMLKQYFEGKALREISAQLVEQFKKDRLNTPTKKGTSRRLATVNRE